MRIHLRKAWQLIRLDGPRWYFEVESVAGVGAHLDHPLWRHAGVRFLVHMRPVIENVVQTPEHCADDLIGNIQAFRATYLAAQPAGTTFPGYGIRFPGIGGAYAWRDFAGLLPFASHHPDDSLPPFVNGFTYSPLSDVPGGPLHANVTTSGHTPTQTTFKVGSGDVYGRPDGGLVNNTVTFPNDTITPSLRGFTGMVKTWAGNVATLELPGFPSGVLPTDDDFCTFGTFPPPACYRFTAARVSLAAWSELFFAQLDEKWPSGLERPEWLACTTENIGEPDVAWNPTSGSLPAYIAAIGTEDPWLLTDSQTFEDWLDEHARKLDGTPIDLDDPPDVAPRSPQAQDYRSLAYGAFVVGLAWTWQLSFVNRMKQTWPRTRFIQYLLHAGNRSSPMRNQPGEVFYHGEPWPPDVGHSHDEYHTILPYMFVAAGAWPGTVDVPVNANTFTVVSGSEFLTPGGWGASDRDLIRFDLDTTTPGLRGHEADITSWNAGTRTLVTATLPVGADEGDTFKGFIEEIAFIEWETMSVGWAVWKAWEAWYGHTTGTLDERYRATCVSFVADAAGRMCRGWTDRDVAPFVSRRAEDHPQGDLVLKDITMYPDPALATQPGIQTRADWTQMLAGMMTSGIPSVMVFEDHEELETTLDAWLEIFQGVRGVFNRNRGNLEAIAHHRNRNWRSRRTWRG